MIFYLFSIFSHKFSCLFFINVSIQCAGHAFNCNSKVKEHFHKITIKISFKVFSNIT